MDKETVAEALIAGPITDAGQLLLALVINNLAGPNGWAVITGKQLNSLARIGERTGRDKLNHLVKMGVVEWQKKPPQALRLTISHRQNLPLHRQEMPLHRQNLPLAGEQDHRQEMPLDRQNLPLHRQNLPVENASAYLPKRYKDKEKEVKEKNPPPPPGELVLVADNPAPESPRLDQPAAQPPAVVEQGDLLPVPAKPKKKSRAKPKGPIPADYYPTEQTLAAVIALGFTPEESLAELGAFKLHYEESGKQGNAWGTTYLNWYKRKLKWRKQDEQTTEQRQRYTDASGRPISEREATVRDSKLRFLADLESGVLDNFDLDTPV